MSKTAPTRQASRREQEAQQRRQEILKSARTLFIEKGFRNTTLDEIAERAAFGKGTIYNYFSSKDDLFRDIVFDLADEIAAVTRTAMDAAGPDARSQLRAYAETAISQFYKHNDINLMVMREHHHLDAQMLEQFTRHFLDKLTVVVEPLAAGISAGEIRELSPQRLALLFDGLIRMYCMMASRAVWPGEAQSPGEVAELLVSIFFDGVLTHSHSG
jgi:TetR/AcrR family transcriptional regulator, repressor of fatR-cypB operon